VRNILVVLLFVPLFSWGQDESSTYQLLWEISSDHSKTSYLFGSLHSNDKRVFNLSDSVFITLDAADMVVLEADIFSAFDWLDTRYGDVELEYDSNGDPFTTSDHATRTAYGDEDGMPQFLDAFFQQYCLNAGKQFVALETVQSQLDLLKGSGLSSGYNRNYESFLFGKEELLEMYLEGDIYQLNNFMVQALSSYGSFYDDLIVKRNLEMADKLDSLMQENNLFCAVGAGHLAGGPGIINLLRSKGYSVRCVEGNFSEQSHQAKKNVFGARTYTYEHDQLGVHAIFPGRPAVLEEEFDEDVVQLVFKELGQGNSYEIDIHKRTENYSLEELAEIHIPSSEESAIQKIELKKGGEGYQGLGSTYWDGVHWVRIIMSENVFVIIKAYGGNKFMNSNRPFRFFDNVWVD
jgi:uncharacterized protein YbaP (TraB family)